MEFDIYQLVKEKKISQQQLADSMRQLIQEKEFDLQQLLTKKQIRALKCPDPVDRYTTEEMAELFDPKEEAGLYRILWAALLDALLELGVEGITQKMVEEMWANVDVTDDEMQLVEKFEETSLHIVMAHIEVFKKRLSPETAAFVHLACTSCFVLCNATALIHMAAAHIVQNKLTKLVQLMDQAAMLHKDLPCVGLTHGQSAQPVTVGKRLEMFNRDFLAALQRLQFLVANEMYCLGAKDATGTQDSYLRLFKGDKDKMARLELLLFQKLAHRTAFAIETKVTPIAGQTNPRDMDDAVLEAMGRIGAVLHRFAENIRLWQMLQEVSEPFGKSQVGSSRMAYKQNPMRSERICSLAQLLVQFKGLSINMHQWFERSLNDSAIRRLVLPMVFKLADYIITVACNVVEGLVVNEEVVAANLDAHMNNIMTANILDKMVTHHHRDRNEVHEKIRQITLKMDADRKKGIHCSIATILKDDQYFSPVHDSIDGMMAESYTGMCAEQVQSFHDKDLAPVRAIECDPFDIRFTH